MSVVLHVFVQVASVPASVFSKILFSYVCSALVLMRARDPLHIVDTCFEINCFRTDFSVPTLRFYLVRKQYV